MDRELVGARIIIVLLTVMSFRRTGAACKDNTTSGATGHGACSHHGGVRHWRYAS